MRCSRCGGRMRYIIDTPHAIDENADDDTNLFEYWVCPKCGRWEAYKKRDDIK